MDIKVFEQAGQLWTTSLEVAGKFEKEHRTVLRAIKRLECSAEFRLHHLVPTTYQDDHGREQPMVILSRSGFSMVAMGFTGKVAIAWKEKFIAAFDLMEKRIIQLSRQAEKRGQLDWQQARQDGKLDRRQQTDVIKEFIVYAQNQGSKSAHHYYKNISKMENQALFILSQAFPKPDNFRDILDTFQLGHIRSADNIINKALREGMDRGMFYKDIFQMAKQRVLQFAELIGQTTVIPIATVQQSQASLM